MKQVTAVLLGAGARGAEAYARYALQHPQELRFVAVAEPREERRKAFARAHNIAPEHCFESWEALLAKPKLAQSALVCTSDNHHIAPASAALRQGYALLCEKPLGKNQAEILAFLREVQSSGLAFMICYVLRFSPFYRQIKHLLSQGRIGKLVCVQAMESVGYWHAAHSFVRGNWANEEASSPMLLQKCSHDMDILGWLVGSPCTQVSSFGGLQYFRAENAPSGAAQRCLDGCIHRDTCPYEASRFYHTHPKAQEDGFAKVVSLDNSPEALTQALQTGSYGRCVFHCGNNVVDHQVVNLAYQNGVHASFTMSAFTMQCHRSLTLMGSHGEIVGDMEAGEIVLHDFATQNRESYQIHAPSTGHSGSDEAMMRAFVQRLSGEGPPQKEDAYAALESHLVALAAEQARLEGGVVRLGETG